MAKLTVDGYQEYNLCGDEYLRDSRVALTFSDDCHPDDVILTFENYVAEDGRITISKKALLKAFGFCKE